jgi:hypothetical protein
MHALPTEPPQSLGVPDKTGPRRKCSGKSRTYTELRPCGLRMTGNFRIANMTGCRGLAAELANVPVDVLFRMGTRAARIDRRNRKKDAARRLSVAEFCVPVAMGVSAAASHCRQQRRPKADLCPPAQSAWRRLSPRRHRLRIHQSDGHIRSVSARGDEGVLQCDPAPEFQGCGARNAHQSHPYGAVQRWLALTEGISLPYADIFRRKIGLPVIANGGFEKPSVHRGRLADWKCEFVSMARALIANPDLPKFFADGHAPERPCTHCNRCAARAATSPLGCYEPVRFPSRAAMQDQIMDWNRPAA